MTRHHEAPPRLRITGLVGNPLALSPGELSALPGVEARVPGRKGKPDTFGPAVELEPLLARAQPAVAATHATCVSADGAYTASIPLELLRDRGMVMHTPDGPSPWRLVVPEGDTLCWNVKGLVSLELTAGEVADSVPDNPPH